MRGKTFRYGRETGPGEELAAVFSRGDAFDAEGEGGGAHGGFFLRRRAMVWVKAPSRCRIICP